MLGKRTVPTGSPDTFVRAAIDPACCRAGRHAADNKHSVLTRVAMAVTYPAIADHAAVLGLGPEGRTGRRQNHQRQGKCCHPFHESNLPVKSNGSQHSGLSASRPLPGPKAAALIGSGDGRQTNAVARTGVVGDALVAESRARRGVQIARFAYAEFALALSRWAPELHALDLPGALATMRQPRLGCAGQAACRRAPPLRRLAFADGRRIASAVAQGGGVATGKVVSAPCPCLRSIVTRQS
jgi:hypothetical protein